MTAASTPPSTAVQAATRLERQMNVRLAVWFVVGLCVWTALEFARYFYFSDSLRAWTLRGLAMPVLALMMIAATVSSASLRSSRSATEPVPKHVRHEDLVRMFESGDDEGLRVVRGTFACLYVVAFVYGVLASFVVAFNVV